MLYLQRLAWQTRDAADRYDPVLAQPPAGTFTLLSLTSTQCSLVTT